jgi:hypothetical protein
VELKHGLHAGAKRRAGVEDPRHRGARE